MLILAVVSDVGELEVASSRDRPVRACRKNIQSNGSHESDTVSDRWSDFQSSGSDYVPSDSPNTPNFFDLVDTYTPEELSGEIPLQSPVTKQNL